MSQQLPAWARRDLRKTGMAFWRSRFARESLAKAQIVMVLSVIGLVDLAAHNQDECICGVPPT